MKNKFYCLVAISCFSIFNAQAQLEKGNLLIGGQIGDMNANIYNSNNNANNSISLGLYPKFGYFFSHNFVVGLQPSIHSTFAKNFFSNGLGMNAFTRLYFHKGRVDLKNIGRFFINAGTGILNNYARQKEVNGSKIINTTLSGNAFGGIGYAYFITNQVGLEVVGNMEHNWNFDNNYSITNFSVRVGLQIYLTKQQYKCKNKHSNSNDNSED